MRNIGPAPDRPGPQAPLAITPTTAHGGSKGGEPFIGRTCTDCGSVMIGGKACTLFYRD
ncbi:MAG: hypothetical protein M3134_09765 [Actinomycetota bacterium]|nr:hypothetical protein [Actinomycetota bacterium]